MEEKILILDFGSQYTQLIARRIRELNIYSEIVPFNTSFDDMEGVKGVILSGSPCSIFDENAPEPHLDRIIDQVPILGVCYGAQYIAHKFGGQVVRSEVREYGRANLNDISGSSALFKGISKGSQVWMSHGDSIKELSEDFELTAGTEDVPVAAYRSREKQIYGLQFHPEVTHSEDGLQLLKNFTIDICGCNQSWTPEHLIDSIVDHIKTTVGEDKVVLGLSGGVDSSVSAVLIDKAIGDQLTCIFVDNGLLRKDEFDQVLEDYKHLGLNVVGVDAKDQFYSALKDISDPELKRKAIGNTFINVFDQEAHKVSNVKWLAQGTIYPDVIESVSVNGPSVTIKSHHNVGGLPEKMNLNIVEPLRLLFKDEVRRLGTALGMSSKLLGRHPFPGPGLGIRILGDITSEKVHILQEVDAIFIQGLREQGIYDDVWQAGVILLPIHSVGVMGDERTYEQVVALRAVTSVDGMTADWSRLPYDFLAKISNRIINRVKGVNRVVYDISSKPPATIEWE